MKILSIKLFIVFILLGASFVIIQSCEKDVNWNHESKVELNRVMHDLYYWFDQTPTVNVDDYKSPVELMEALKVNPPDKWSYVTTRQEFDSYSLGIYYGFGFGSVFDLDGKLWISYIFKSSPLTAKGIGRGWQIATIDGTAPTADNFSDLIGANKLGLSKTIGFISPEGSSVTYTFSKIEVEMNTILFDSVYTIDSKKIGYMVLNSFIEPTVSELNTCFAKFKVENTTELIVDLRYNGGGDVDISNQLASLIGGNVANDGIYATYYHNSNYASSNHSIYFSSLTNSLTLSRAVFITTNRTASASELVINGLKPFMTVALVGSKTHGKPVGMYVLKYNEVDWVYVPICFSFKNANGVGDYFDGLAVDVEAIDDYTLPFGDVNEDSFAAALTYLGVSPVKGLKTKTALHSKAITGKGLYEEIGAW